MKNCLSLLIIVVIIANVGAKIDNFSLSDPPIKTHSFDVSSSHAPAKTASFDFSDSTNTINGGTEIPATPNPEIPPAPNPDGNSGGEPRVSYYTPAGYAPSPNDPLLIKKVIKRDESGKGVGNRLRVYVEITKRDRKRTKIEDLDIYEIVDDSLQIISPEDDPRAALINYKKSSSLGDIGELKDNLFRPGSYYSQNAENRNVIYPKGMEPKVVVISPKVPSTMIKLKWDNISINGSADGSSLLKLLREDFNVKWASPETSNISSVQYKYINI
jgi:hypothetical protein